jgi:DNA-binding NarL/FixJ family response regulator
VLDRPAAEPSALLGRERELERFGALVRRAEAARASAVVRIVAASGFGKTALVEAALRQAGGNDRVVFGARCYASQRRTPGAALRRLVADHLGTLSDSKRRYLSGLELELTSSATGAGRFELAFVRLMDGLLHDHACVLAFDDAHWIDQQTLNALHRLVEAEAARPLVILAAHRSGYDVPLPLAAESLTIVLGPLRSEHAEQLVRRTWPDVPGPVAASIVERSCGVPFDLIALADNARADRAATADDVASTAHAVLRETIVALPPDQREFLQLCSLIREPIELSVAQRVVAGGTKLDRLIARSSGRYLDLDGAVLRFKHGLIADAARSTISSPLALRRRILAAYLAEQSPRPGDDDRIAALAAEVGDVETEFRALVRLATASYAQDAYESAVGAFEKALTLRRPADTEFVALFNQYSMALRLVGRWASARRVLEDAVEEGIGRAIEGIGVLASALLWIVRMETDRDVAQAEFERLVRHIAAPADRRDVLAMGAQLAAEAANAERFDSIRTEMDALPETPSRYAATVLHIAEATLMSRLGRFEDAWRAIEIARAHVDRQRSVHKFSVDCFGNQIRIREHGCAGFRIQLSWLQPREDGTLSAQEPPQAVMLYALELAAIVDFARGNWDAALAKIDSANLAAVSPCPARTNLLSIAAAIAALARQTSELAPVIEADLRLSFERALWQRALPLAFWWAAFLAETRPGDAAALVDPLRRYLAHPVDSSTFFFPLARVLYAVRAKDLELVRVLLECRHDERAPWDVAHDLLAAGMAHRALRDGDAKPLLARARDAFEALDATFFTAYAADSLGAAGPRERELLRALHVSDAAPKDQPPPAADRLRRRSQPTLREREVAALIAEGCTNRQVAERLTLSERTVEVHVANLFDKLGVSSRTQLVRFVLEERSDAEDVVLPARR